MQNGKGRAFLHSPGFQIAVLFVVFGVGFFLGSWRMRSRSADVQIRTRAVPIETTAEPLTRIDLNSADSETLQTLPGIGPALAERILAYREERGPFTYAYEITNIAGIGSATYEKLRELVTVEPQNTEGE